MSTTFTARTSTAALVCTAVVAIAAPPKAFAAINLQRAANAAGDRVEAYARALKDRDETAAWSVRGCHAIDEVQVECKGHVKLARKGRTTLHRDPKVTVVVRGGKYVARIG